MRRKYLSTDQLIKLSDWVRQNWTQFEGRSDPDVCAAASRDLGFPLSQSSVASVCAALGIKRVKSKQAAPKNDAPGVSREDFRLLLTIVSSLQSLLPAGASAGLDALIVKYTD